MYYVRQPEDIYDAISLMIAYFMQRNDEHTVYGSGWVHERVLDFQFTKARAKVLNGSDSLDLPSLLVKKIKSLFDVLNDVGEHSKNCFMHAIISYFEFKKHEIKENLRNFPTSKKFKKASYFDNFSIN